MASLIPFIIEAPASVLLFYRAVDLAGQTVDCLLTNRRDMKAARRFLRKAIGTSGLPEKITIDKSGANKDVISEFNSSEKTSIKIRQNKFLNNLIEQDHRSIKQLFKFTLGFQSFRTASITIRGFESMRIIRKKQINLGDKTPSEVLCPL